MRSVGVEVDSCDGALLRAPGARLVALEEKVRTVIVAEGRAALAPKHEVGILVGFRLRRLGVGAA